jgi:hypothetical protein
VVKEGKLSGPSVPEQRRIVVVSGILELPEKIRVAERLKDSSRNRFEGGELGLVLKYWKERHANPL